MSPRVKARHPADVWCCRRSLVEATLAALIFAIMSDKAFMAFVATMAVVA